MLHGCIEEANAKKVPICFFIQQHLLLFQTLDMQIKNADIQIIPICTQIYCKLRNIFEI